MNGLGQQLELLARTGDFIRARPAIQDAVGGQIRNALDRRSAIPARNVQRQMPGHLKQKRLGG